jgi:cell division septum initiation protein DivIVA
MRKRSRVGELGERLARAFSAVDQTHSSQQTNGREDGWLDDEPAAPWEESPPRFSLARQGYERGAVDQYVAELEQELVALDEELAQLHAQAASPGEVTTEIQRVGEQTSAILIAAHEQAQQTTRLAQEEADRQMAEAASNATAITTEANQQLSELEREKGSLGQERERLIDDIRTISAALSSLAADADQRFAPDPPNRLDG